MIHNASFRRKVIYLGLIALLLIPLYVVGHPAVGDPRDPTSSPGGRLAQLRTENDLSPAELGEIDPTSESMKLATLGMRGIAANILWTKANDYKKKENWEGLVAVVNQMARLQPNFISVWEFQSHNLSYNISVEQDDYRFRYLWVKKGIEFLIQGTKYNRREPKLFWTLGWYTGQKFGRADENKQFRRLYRADHDFHELQSQYVNIYGDAGGPDGKPDTWLTSRLWFNRAYEIVDNQGKPVRGKAPHIFFADGPKALMNYSVTIEEEGYLDEKAEASWRRAGDEWLFLGSRLVPTSWGPVIRLNDEEKLESDGKRITAELDQMLPGLRETIRQERIAKLNTKERDALDLPDEKIIDAALYQSRMEAQAKTLVTNRDLAERAPAEIRAKAHRLAKQATDAATIAEYVDRYRQNVNFEYWRTRCTVEQLHNTVQARKHVYAAKQLADKAEFDDARAEFEKAWDLWAKTIESNPSLLDQLTADDLFDDVKAYCNVLIQIDAKLPADFKLKSLIERYGNLPENIKTIMESSPTATTPDVSATKSNTQKPEAGKPEPTKTDAGKADASKEKADAGKADAVKADAVKEKADAGKADAGKADAAKEKADAGKADAGKADAVKSDAGKEKADAGKAEPSKEKPSSDSEKKNSAPPAAASAGTSP